MISNATHIAAEMITLNNLRRATLSLFTSDDDTKVEIEMRVEKEPGDGVYLADPPSFSFAIDASELHRAMCAAMLVAKGQVDE
jgi:hypothetical protein